MAATDRGKAHFHVGLIFKSVTTRVCGASPQRARLSQPHFGETGSSPGPGVSSEQPRPCVSPMSVGLHADPFLSSFPEPHGPHWSSLQGSAPANRGLCLSTRNSSLGQSQFPLELRILLRDRTYPSHSLGRERSLPTYRCLYLFRSFSFFIKFYNFSHSFISD